VIGLREPGPALAAGASASEPGADGARAQASGGAARSDEEGNT
jgi:hypothetical protein